MRILSDILYKARLEDVLGSTQIEIESVCFDSRAVKPKCLFVAIKGTASDGHQFIGQAIKAGAIAIVCENIPKDIQEDITYIKVKNSSEALGYIAANFYDNPSSKLKLVGITGTNGKTTTATLLYKLFRALGFKVGLLSTVNIRIDKEELNATHTTPDALRLNELLAEMVQSGCTYCFMEVSSHAVVQHRITGLDFAGGVFTNITHDHLDYHKTFEEYIKAKQGFFNMLGSESFALSNYDDKNGKIMVQNCKSKTIRFYALRSMADFKCKIMENQLGGLLLNIDGNEVLTRLIGTFNAYNLLAVYSTAVLLGKDKLDVLTALSNLEAVEGRFQYLKTPDNIIGIVDYAHTPDALENVLKTIKDIRTGNEKVITIVGCGGDRDALKRPVMAKIACQWSDKVILTSDNPRSEDPALIIEQMKTGLDPVDKRKVISIVDRKEAINTGCNLANAGDIILVAGKGHEKYQEIKGIKNPFDDMLILKEVMSYE